MADSRDIVTFARQVSNDLDTGDIYHGLDRFGRVKVSRWVDDSVAPLVDADRIRHG